MLIDSHCHIHDIKFFPDGREEAYKRAVESGVQMIAVGTSQEDAKEAVKFADSHDGVWAVVGVHPHDTKSGWQAVESILAPQATSGPSHGSLKSRAIQPSKVVGIGEIGLDYFYDNSPRDIQIEALEQQLQWAVDYGLPVSFHVREAYADFWPVFDNFQLAGQPVQGVLHCFTDTIETLEKALVRGLYIGVNGISTFTKDLSQQEMFRSIPLEKMLLETDAPFLTPRPFRGKVNEPAYVREVAKYQAEVRDLSLSDISSITAANTKALFKL